LYNHCKNGEWELLETLLDGNVKGWGVSTKWTLIGDKNTNSKNQSKKLTFVVVWPGSRGGHQMAISKEKIYLLGGYNGTKNLSDFWVWHMDTKQWECITPDTEQ
jgi:hypothetical protein